MYYNFSKHLVTITALHKEITKTTLGDTMIPLDASQQ